ncbi:MAG: transposase [Alphaproteobacteria bacterium]|nr:MAG: transposase [Alphaproteobacteria bacterium]TMK31347.1 MAG: transposase [Alphaproteobacteria bacterium]
MLDQGRTRGWQCGGVRNQPCVADEQAALDPLVAIVWPDGIVCPRCGVR